MLVLTRKRNEEIIIGEDGPNQITINIAEIRGDKVKVGVTADKTIPVHRREVYEAIHKGVTNETTI